MPHYHEHFIFTHFICIKFKKHANVSAKKKEGGGGPGLRETYSGKYFRRAPFKK